MSSRSDSKGDRAHSLRPLRASYIYKSTEPIVPFAILLLWVASVMVPLRLS